MKSAGRHANTNLLNNFNEKFKKDEQGKSRNWREIEEEDITALFKQTRSDVEAIIEQFKKIELPANITESPEPSVSSIDIKKEKSDGS